jgi:hypothetical protein
MKTSWSASQCIHWITEGHSPQAEQLTFLPGRIYSMRITSANNLGSGVAKLNNIFRTNITKAGNFKVKHSSI